MSYGLGSILLAIGLWKANAFPRWLTLLWAALPPSDMSEKLFPKNRESILYRLGSLLSYAAGK